MSNPKKRLYNIDALRGFALILMGLDHAAFFSKTGVQAEHYIGLQTEIDTIEHWGTGLMTNIATPTFWFISGISIALFIDSRRKRGLSEWEISRFLLTRAFVILLLDHTIVAWIWGYSFNVLSSIGVSLAIMSIIRLLPLPLVAITMVSCLIGYQWLYTTFPVATSEPGAFWQAMWLTYSQKTTPDVVFPVLGWGHLMGIGFVLGQNIKKPIFQQSRTWVLMGCSLLIVWFIVRVSSGYGNLVPYQDEQPIAYFLIMSKSPPSLVYLLFNLSLAFFVMAALIAKNDWLQKFPLKWMVISGQASLFFYVAHLVVYRFIGEPITYLLPNGVFPGIIRGYMVWFIGLIILVVISNYYNNFRRNHPNTILKYL